MLRKWKAATASGFVFEPRWHGAPPPVPTTGIVLQGKGAASS